MKEKQLKIYPFNENFVEKIYCPQYFYMIKEEKGEKQMIWKSVIAKNNLVSIWIQDRIKIIGGLLVAASAVNIWLTRNIIVMVALSSVLGMYFLKLWLYSFLPVARGIDKGYRWIFGWNIGDEVVVNLPYGRKVAGVVVDSYSSMGVDQYEIERFDMGERAFINAFPWNMESYAYADY